MLTLLVGFALLGCWRRGSNLRPLATRRLRYGGGQ